MTIDDRSIDDRFPAELAESLHEDPIVSPAASPEPTPAFDVGTLIRRGERVRRRRGLVGACATAMVVALISVGTPILLHRVHGAPVAPPRPIVTIAPTIPASQIPMADCTVARFTIPDHRVISLISMDPTGRYFLAATQGHTPNSRSEVLYDRSTGTVTPLPRAAVDPRTVNSSGTVIGAWAPYAGWVYRDGRMTTLSAPAGKAASTMDINGQGDIVGYIQSTKGQGAFTGPLTAVEWPAGHPDQMRVLPAAGQSVAQTVNDNGWVGGSVNGKPYVWAPDGKGRALSFDWHGMTDGTVYEIVGTKAVGLPSAVRPGEWVQIVWDLTTGVPTYYSYPLNEGLTTNGLMPGQYLIRGPSATAPVEAFPLVISLDGRIWRLPTLPGSTDDEVTGMSADGRILIGDTSTPVIWHC